VLLFAAIATAQVSPAEHIFSGTLGNNSRIQMRLRRDGGTLSGVYFYERVGQDLSLRGEVNPEGDFTLREYDRGGAQTGVFKGKWKAADCEGCGDVLAGNWSRADGTHALPFNLKVYPVSFPGPIRLMTRSLSESRLKGKSPYEINIRYPQIEGGGGATAARFNRMMLAYVAQDAAAYRKSILEGGSGGLFDLSYELRLANDDLISVVFSYYSCYGSPSGCNAYSETLNYDLKRGHEIKFEELFRRDADYTQLLRDYCVGDLKNQYRGTEWARDDQLRLNIEKVVVKNRKWTLTPAGLDLIFDSPEMNPPGRGDTNVIVPYTVLREVIQPDGPLAIFAREFTAAP
jgi:hypothetical protein